MADERDAPRFILEIGNFMEVTLGNLDIELTVLTIEQDMNGIRVVMIDNKQWEREQRYGR